MSLLKKISFAALLFTFFVSSYAIADMCPEKHPQYPDSQFLHVIIMSSSQGETACIYNKYRWIELPKLNKPDNRYGVWRESEVSYCGVPYGGTRETCIFWPISTRK